LLVKNVVKNQFGRVAACLSSQCVQCTVQSETVIGVCTVHSGEWDCYWCVYSAQCRVRLLLVCVQCTVQS